MKRVLVVLVATLAFMLSLVMPLRAASLGDADMKAIAQVIESQLDAFAADDSAAAYSHAAPVIQKMLPNADAFMKMVIGGYAPVYRNTARKFGKLETDSFGRPAMRVELTDQDGRHFEAVYSMVQLPDGHWKITACTLSALPGTNV